MGASRQEQDCPLSLFDPICLKLETPERLLIVRVGDCLLSFILSFCVCVLLVLEIKSRVS